MNPDPDAPGAAVDAGNALRRQAEEHLRRNAGGVVGDIEAMSVPDMRVALHELRVHQIELEMQNEELRRVQAQLEASRTRYFDLYDLAPVGYCTVDERGMVVQSNLAAATLLGVSRAQMVLTPIGSFIFSDDQDIYYLHRKQLAATGNPQSCELRMVKSDQATVWIKLSISLSDGVDGRQLIRLMLSDISEVKLMASALQEREERYRTMVEWSPEAVLVHRNGKIIFANKAAAALFGAANVKPLLEQPILDRVHPDFQAVSMERMKALGQTNGVLPRIGVVMLKLDGTPINVEVQGIWTVFDREPAIQAVLHDVTELKQLVSALKQKSEELQLARIEADKANQAKSDFLSGMSHELRSPLHAVLGYAQLLDTGKPEPTPLQKRNIEQILQGGWYLLALIDDILDLALIEAGKMASVMEPVSLGEVLRECQALVELRAQERGIRLIFPQLDAAVVLFADRRRVKQVLVNLLSNAIKYNTPGGFVELSCLATDPHHLRLGVRDSGPGLDAGELAQLFQPFNRLGRMASGTEGTGIGLVMCKRLMALMEGSIGVHSEPGAGSEFWVEWKRPDGRSNNNNEG